MSHLMTPTEGTILVTIYFCAKIPTPTTYTSLLGAFSCMTVVAGQHRPTPPYTESVSAVYSFGVRRPMKIMAIEQAQPFCISYLLQLFECFSIHHAP